MQPSTPAAEFPGVTHSRVATLKKLGIRTAQDLAFLFPRDYEFPAPPAKVDQLVDGEPASLVGEITEAEVRSRFAGKSIFGALIENESGAFRVLFFNQPFSRGNIKSRPPGDDLGQTETQRYEMGIYAPQSHDSGRRRRTPRTGALTDLSLG